MTPKHFRTYALFSQRFSKNRAQEAAEAGLSPIYIGLKDKIVPNPVNGNTIGTSVFPTEIDAQWQAASDNTGGIGGWQYQIYRNGVHWTDVTSPSFADQGASPGTVYNYTIYTVDWHLNKSTGTTFSVTTPGTGPNPAVVTPPARTGVRSTGSYWGAGSEQIDMLSGNLNFTLPLFKAMGRGGWGQTFALSYNCARLGMPKLPRRRSAPATWSTRLPSRGCM